MLPSGPFSFHKVHILPLSHLRRPCPLLSSSSLRPRPRQLASPTSPSLSCIIHLRTLRARYVAPSQIPQTSLPFLGARLPLAAQLLRDVVAFLAPPLRRLRNGATKPRSRHLSHLSLPAHLQHNPRSTRSHGVLHLIDMQRMQVYPPSLLLARPARPLPALRRSTWTLILQRPPFQLQLQATKPGQLSLQASDPNTGTLLTNSTLPSL